MYGNKDLTSLFEPVFFRYFLYVLIPKKNLNKSPTWLYIFTPGSILINIMPKTKRTTPEITSFAMVEKPLVHANARNTSANKITKISPKLKPLINSTFTFVDLGIILAAITLNSPIHIVYNFRYFQANIYSHFIINLLLIFYFLLV